MACNTASGFITRLVRTDGGKDKVLFDWELETARARMKELRKDKSGTYIKAVIMTEAGNVMDQMVFINGRWSI